MNSVTRKQLRKLPVPIPSITMDGHQSENYNIVVAKLKTFGLTAKSHHQALEYVERHLLKKDEIVLLVTSKEIPKG